MLRYQGLGFRVCVFAVLGLGFCFKGCGFTVQGWESRVLDLQWRFSRSSMYGSGFVVYGLGVEGSGFWVVGITHLFHYTLYPTNFIPILPG